MKSQAEASVQGAVGRYSERISRVQVHLEDENSHKAGHVDKRCMMEARVNGLAPIAVTHHAGTVEQAMDGAAAKLERAIDSSLGRLDDRR